MRLISRRKFADYKMMVAIQHNKPKETLDALTEQENRLFTPDKTSDDLNTGVDKGAFAALKSVMRKNPRMVVKD